MTDKQINDNHKSSKLTLKTPYKTTADDSLNFLLFFRENKSLQFKLTACQIQKASSNEMKSLNFSENKKIDNNNKK